MHIPTADCQRFANACLDLAERALPREKEMLHEMANAWLKLAAEQLDQLSADARNASMRGDTLSS